jgi:hypothetical protein
MARFKDSFVDGVRVTFSDVGFGMVHARAPNMSRQVLGIGKNKTEALNDIKKTLRKTIRKDLVDKARTKPKSFQRF